MSEVAAGTLPTSASRLVGRANELPLLVELLTVGSARLVTLCGVGGIGKTRLALEVARAAQVFFADGICFVALAPFREPELVVSAILSAVEPGEAPGRRDPLEALKRSLQRRQLLLVLDNFEQVIAAAPLVAELLAACPRVSILATSRAPLRLSWEHEVAIGPLDVPTDDLDRHPEAVLAFASVALLVERMAGIGAREQLGIAGADAAWAEGLHMSLDEAVALALSDAVAPVAVVLPNDLTRREAEVLRMLASGSTNKEIAAHLSVSVATVERHLANLYPKIGARGRTEATAFAISRGLVVR